MSVRECISDMSDEDQKVSAMMARMPHAGFRMVKGSLRAMGHRVQWRRVRKSLQSVDGAGIIARMIQLCCIARQKYSVPAHLSLVHIDTNQKLGTKVLRCIMSPSNLRSYFNFFILTYSLTNFQ